MPLRLSDTELILLVLAAFYLSECFCWLPRAAVAFVSRWGGYTPRRDAGFLPNDNGALLPGSFWPAGTLFVCGDPFRSRNLRQRLNAAANLPTDQQRQTIDEIISSLTDTPAMESRYLAFQEATSLLRMVGTLLFLLIFGFAPLLYYTSRTPNAFRLWTFLALLLLYWLIAIVSHFRAHRKLYPAARSERRKRLLMTCCSPAVAMKAADALARPLFQGFHPIAVATVVCRPEESKALAIPLLRELRYPLPASEQPRSETEQFFSTPLGQSFTQRLLARLLQVAASAGLTPAEIETPPPQDEGAVSYCPRCHRQFVIVRDGCDACAGLPLAAFPSADSGRPVPNSSADRKT